jgi:hypothetical protein
LKKAWTKDEVVELIEYKKAGVSDWDIAKKTGRSYPSVNSKVSRLKNDGLLEVSVIRRSSFPVWDNPITTQGDALILTDIEAPFQDSEFMNRVIDLADAWGIKTLHIAGDLLHYDNLSKWGSEWIQSKEDLVEAVIDLVQQNAKQTDMVKVRESLHDAGFLSDDSLSGELREARDVFRSINSFDSVNIALGNHDDRYLRALEKALEPNELLHQLDRHNDERWKIAPYYYTLIETEKGTFRATHPRNAGRNAARDLAVQFHQHIIMGHSHRWSVDRDPSGKFWAIQTGHCVDEKRLAYVMQRDAKRDAHVLGATIIRDGCPFVLCPETPFNLLKRM